mgnify:CR=1 FL=1
MKILITGGAGFVASYLIDECLKNGDEVIVTQRWNEDLSRLKDKQIQFNKEYNAKDIKSIQVENVELTDLSSVIRVINKHRPDVISHLAAQSWVPYSFDNPIYTMKNNIESTLNILEAIRIIQEVDKGKYTLSWISGEMNETPVEYNPLIHICSSSEFYGKVNREDLPITENHKANPGNPYGVSKVAGDFLAQIYEKTYDLRILITRMFTHTGAGRTMMSAENYYAKTIAEYEKMDKNSQMSVSDNPDGSRPYNYVIRTSDEEGMNSLRTWADARDAVRNYYSLFKNQKTGIYNISGQTEKTIQEVLDYLISQSILHPSVWKFEVDKQFVRKINVDKQIVDITKFKQENDWSNEISFEDTMKEILESWRKKV